jgi:hypothetical protein
MEIADENPPWIIDEDTPLSRGLFHALDNGADESSDKFYFLSGSATGFSSDPGFGNI